MNSDPFLSSRSSSSDWFRAIKKPPPYRVGSTRLSLKPYFVAMVGGIIILSLLIVTLMVPDNPERAIKRFANYGLARYFTQSVYNETYPLSRPVVTADGVKFRVALITDLDETSKLDPGKDKWTSYLLLGHLTLSQDRSSASVNFDASPIALTSTLAQKGRGMELSELIIFDGKLFTCDDRTGMIYHIALSTSSSGSTTAKALPWVFLSDGPGDEVKGFKCEWMAVKDKILYVGGLGKEWTSSDGLTLVNHHPMFVKTVSHFGDVLHEDWMKHYVGMRSKAGIHYPGYMIHESAAWSRQRRQWTFLPRRAHAKTYNDKEDEHHATNLHITADQDFTNVQIKTLGPLKPEHGFSSFKFMPDTRDELVVALKSKEVDGKLESFIMVYDVLSGATIMDEVTLPGQYKFEGVEFI